MKNPNVTMMVSQSVLSVAPAFLMHFPTAGSLQTWKVSSLIKERCQGGRDFLKAINHQKS